MLHKTPWFIKKLYPSLIWSLPTTEPVIYLTFDDGPIPGLTEYILDTLADYNAKATFFCVGENIARYSHIAKRAVAEGHVLANHTHNHLNGWKTPTRLYIENVERCQNQVNSVFSGKQQLMRPPYGMIKRKQIRQLSSYQIIMWDVLSRDYDQKVSPEQCLRQSVKHTSNGSIVLFHDNIKAEKNMTYTLPRYLDHFATLGYRFETL